MALYFSIVRFCNIKQEYQKEKDPAEAGSRLTNYRTKTTIAIVVLSQLRGKQYDRLMVVGNVRACPLHTQLLQV